MPSIGHKEDTNDSEAEESPDTDKSSRDDESDSSCASDDDDSSEMDEADCERRRAECLVDMVDLERQFVQLKEQLYRERSSQVACKLDEVRSGKANEYLQPLEELQDNMRIRTEIAGILRELKLINIRNKNEAEQLASHQNFESEKALLWDSIKSDLEDKIRRLEEDRNNVDITSDLWNEQQVNYKRSKRKFDHSGPDKRKKPVTVSGPYIIYMLHETEILEDWTIIRKALKITKQKNEYCRNLEEYENFPSLMEDG